MANVTNNNANDGRNLGVNLNIDEIETKILGFIPALNVETGFVLVKETPYRHVTKKRNPGRWPTWRSSKYKVFNVTEEISVDPKSFDFPCYDGYKVTIDVVLKFRITDPERFYVQNKMGSLKNVIEDELKDHLRKHVAGKTYAEIQSDLGNNRYYLNTFRPQIDCINSTYGIHISTFGIQDLHQPQSIIAANEERERQKIQNKTNEEAAESRKQIATTEKETRKTEAEAEAEARKIFIETIVPKLRDRGMSDDDIIDYIRANLPGAINIVGGQGNYHASVQDGINFQLGMDAVNNLPGRQRTNPVPSNDVIPEFDPEAELARRRGKK